MPLRDNHKYKLKIDGEPQIVEDIRKKIVTAFDNLTFVDEGHKYYLEKENGEREELSSVSELTHLFKEPFDTEAQAAAYALKHGETPEYWKQQWANKSADSCAKGTAVHEFNESYMWLTHGHPELITEACQERYNKETNELDVLNPKEEAAKKFIDEKVNGNVYLIMNEAKMHSCANKELLNLSTNYAGTTDFLLYYEGKTPETSGVIIGDWKTNAKIYSDYSRKKSKKLYYPFNNLYDEPFGVYTIQLNAYQLCLESLGIKVIARRLLWLKEDGTYESLEVPNVTSTLKSYLK